MRNLESLENDHHANHSRTLNPGQIRGFVDISAQLWLWAARQSKQKPDQALSGA